MKGGEVITALKRKLKLRTDLALSERLGMSIPTIQLWKNKKSITSRQIAELVARALKAGANKMEAGAIRPLVEFFPVEKCNSKQRAKYELFDVNDGNGRAHPYLSGLKKELEKHRGVYIFFDSRGQAIYTGKARLQSLWKEMNLAFNRDRGGVQKIKRVNHPTRKQPYRTSDEKARQIVHQEVPLHELAEYFSAYQVSVGMIEDVESLLVRSFANDLLNIRMERFGQQKKANKHK